MLFIHQETPPQSGVLSISSIIITAPPPRPPLSHAGHPIPKKHSTTSILFSSTYRLRNNHRAAVSWLASVFHPTPREARPPSIQLHASSRRAANGRGREVGGGLALGSSLASPVRLSRPPPAVYKPTARGGYAASVASSDGALGFLLCFAGRPRRQNH